ncbi:hypothetical protein [Thiomicrorhabdus sp. 6S3-12]|uniref:hypothetical protein n=1 Tax=Thiomicrorhabdus sp. 6S3-12 TaxID=2819681 RepID=UPI001AAD2BAE|nr:hypothetical protein [Thiomicrorhabdus sp. 6S3-12]MBO1923368.1 hypothetical protein [Thiomicrorhabdus sp. 6S3-12]
MYKSLPVLAAVWLSLLLSGCLGITQPTESDVEEMAKNTFNQEFAGLFLADEVIKENGYKQNDTHYVAELSIKATAQRSLDDYAREIMKDKATSSLDKITRTMAIGMWKMTLPEFAAGDQLDFKRNYLFIKTDNGWMIKGRLENDDGHEQI